jgi:hypothetical protein
MKITEDGKATGWLPPLVVVQHFFSNVMLSSTIRLDRMLFRRCKRAGCSISSSGAASAAPDSVAKLVPLTCSCCLLGSADQTFGVLLSWSAKVL